MKGPSSAPALRTPEELWNRRTAGFLAEIRPYLVYALQSVALAVILLMLGAGVGYNYLLTSAPPSFPFKELAACILLPAAALSPIRTYMKEADLIFLMPMETGMSAYFDKAASRAFRLQLLLLVVSWLAAWPLYAKGAGESGLLLFVHILLVLAAVKKVLLYGRSLELKLSEKKMISFYVTLRTLVAAGTVYLITVLTAWEGTLAAALLLLIYLGCLYPVRSRAVNWTRLVELERRHRAVTFRLLNNFIDVPSVQGRPRSVHAPKKGLGALGGFRHRPEDTYRYLYTLVWLRSEWFGITVRLTLLGVILLAAVRGAWMAGILYALFAGLTALQLKELQKAYRHSDWSFIYPLPEGIRSRSASTVVFRIHALCLALLALASLASMPTPLYSAGWFAVTLLLSYLYSKRQRKERQWS
ncbi:ABC transporter permease [Paenibacillus caseinilyticus]|uniref:ABC transporter permease n=1 Tax=Paenibacillus mucilaginosus K02 TaxID=997761 RepID=I0BSU6_9BACL|nr:ABC transporter permease [Paenibacillus mucilaginosus]AFH65443.1 ABC transporter permease [Paenibacillus mucilaginosus K02]